MTHDSDTHSLHSLIHSHTLQTQLELPFPISIHPKELYGCNSKRSGNYSERGRPGYLTVQVDMRTVWVHDPNGYSMFPITVPEFETISTDWKYMPCGHMERANDSRCISCVNRFKETQ